jgi:hypothetical protein
MDRNSLMADQQESEPVAAPGSAPEGSGSGQARDSQMQPIQNNVASPSSDAPQRIPYWLQQAERFLRVIVRIYLGLLVCFAPWFPPAWDANPLFQPYPGLSHFIAYGAVRGVVSGLGLLNLWIALRDAMRNPADRDHR